MPTAIVIAAGKPGPAQELDIPASAVAIDDAAPEKGDEIEFTIKAKVIDAQGDTLSVEPLECNGQPIKASAETDEKEEDGDEETDPMAIAQKADDEENAQHGL